MLDFGHSTACNCNGNRPKGLFKNLVKAHLNSETLIKKECLPCLSLRTCLHLVKNSAVDTSVFTGVSFIVSFHFSVITTARVNMPLHPDIIVFNRFSEIQLFPRTVTINRSFSVYVFFSKSTRIAFWRYRLCVILVTNNAGDFVLDFKNAKHKQQNK